MSIIISAPATRSAVRAALWQTNEPLHCADRAARRRKKHAAKARHAAPRVYGGPGGQRHQCHASPAQTFSTTANNIKANTGGLMRMGGADMAARVGAQDALSGGEISAVKTASTRANVARRNNERKAGRWQRRREDVLGRCRQSAKSYEKAAEKRKSASQLTSMGIAGQQKGTSSLAQ